MTTLSRNFNPFNRISYWLGQESSPKFIFKGDDESQPSIQELNALISSCERKASLFRLFFYFSMFLMCSMNFVLAVIYKRENRLIVAAITFVVIFFTQMLGWPQYAEKLSSIANNLQEIHDIITSETQLTPTEKVRYSRLYNLTISSRFYSDNIPILSGKDRNNQVNPIN